MQFKPIYPGAALIAALCMLGACSRPTPTEEPLRAVKTLVIRENALRATAQFSGEVRAHIESPLGFRVAGKIIRRPVELGQRVTAGQILAQLDPQDYKLGEAAARAQWAAATTSRDQAAADLRRFRELRAQGFISGAELERHETGLKTAQAQLDQAQAQLSGQGNQSAYTTLVADAAGVVTELHADVGQVVAAGSPVVRVAQDGPRDAVFSVPEDQVTRLKRGSPAKVEPWPQGVSLAGTVREVSASADPVTRTFAVKVALPAAGALPLGSTVTISTAAPQHAAQSAITVPTSAIFKDGNASAVWVLEPSTMTVRLQPVQIATADGNQVVVDSGLKPGMEVVSAGVHVLTQGQKVLRYQALHGEAAQPSAAVTKQ